MVPRGSISIVAAVVFAQLLNQINEGGKLESNFSDRFDYIPFYSLVT